MRWRWNPWLRLVLILALFLVGGCAGADDPLARVNEETITRRELDRFINLMGLCNPELEAIIEAGAEDSDLHQAEREFLQILINIKLVNQEAKRLSLPVDSLALAQKTETLVDDLVRTHYGGSAEQFHRKREQLKLSDEDLALIPRYELQLQSLFDYISASLTEDDLVQFVEENPHLLQQEASLQVYRISFLHEQQAGDALEQLQQGKSIESLTSQSQIPGLEAESLGWITAEDPFVDAEVKELLFSLPQDAGGAILESGDYYHLYWIVGSKPARILEFAEVKEQALLYKQYILFQDYFNVLWSEGAIEILH